jgi:hypothetical protein
MNRAKRRAKQRQRAKRAQAADRKDRAASQHAPGRQSGPPSYRPRRPPPPEGNAKRMRRLRKNHPELHAMVMDGTLSVYQADVVAGFRAPEGRPPQQKDREHLNTSALEMECWLSPDPDKGSLFASDDARREFWFQHRARLMGYWAHDGVRPWAWWKYEAPDKKWPGLSRQRSTLWAANLLTADEVEELEEFWWEEFNRSLEPGFTFDDGPRGILTGREAHIAHLVFVDCPAALADQWCDYDDAA